MTSSPVCRKALSGLAKASAILTLLTSGCFVVIGDLPEPHEQDTGSGARGGVSGSGGQAGSTGGGGAGAMSSGGVGGAAGDAASGTGGTGGDGSGGALGDGGGSAGTGGTVGQCVSNCDCDGDGALAEGSCGGDDCDDNDARAKPGQTTFFDTQSATVGWDWNCSGQPERESDHSNECGVLLNLGCTNRPDGWLGKTPPPCGATGQWGKCKLGPVNLTCIDDVVDQNKVVKCH